MINDVNMHGYEKPFTLKQFAQFALCTENDSEAYTYFRRHIVECFRSTFPRTTSEQGVLERMMNQPEFVNSFCSQRVHKDIYRFMRQVHYAMIGIAVDNYGRDWLRDENNSLEGQA